MMSLLCGGKDALYIPLGLASDFASDFASVFAEVLASVLFFLSAYVLRIART
jgi:hypothetical protein